MSTVQEVLHECGGGDVQALSQLKNGLRVTTHDNRRQTATETRLAFVCYKHGSFLIVVIRRVYNYSKDI